MSTCSLDALLHALQEALTSANTSLRHRREARIMAEKRSMQVQIPQEGEDGATQVPVSIPLKSFRDPRMPQASMLSVEFDCTFQYSKPSREGRAELHIAIGQPGGVRLRKRPRHQMRITCHARGMGEPRVEIDGHRLSLGGSDTEA